ncbi:hypothetical protein LINPERPRIM_LOCUS6120 [Linum perenne]
MRMKTLKKVLVNQLHLSSYHILYMQFIVSLLQTNATG